MNAPKNETTVAVDAERLRGGIEISRLFASQDGTDHPHLCSIALRVGDGNLVMYATDRYTVSRVTMPAEGDWGAPLLLRPAQFKVLQVFLCEVDRRELVKIRRSGMVVEVEMAAMAMTLPSWPTVDPFTEAWLSQESVEQIEGWYDAPAGPVEKVGLNPVLAARFAKVHEFLPYESYQTSTWKFTAPNKPVRVDVGAHFAGLIMPIRLDASGALR